MAVVALAVRGSDGRWLMQRRPEGKHHAGLWEFPGGKVESGEDPRLALVREIREELGIDLDPAYLTPAGFADGAVSQAGIPIVILLYTASRYIGIPHALEGGAIGWFTPEEMRELPMPPLDRQLISGLQSQ